jgi:MarR family transcriptional regulator, 2-MHQ and catechol-resistance regulon repressor
MSNSTDVTAPQLWIVLAKCHRALSRLVESTIEAAGLCLSDFMVLEVLLHKGPLTITEIQDKVLLATGSMTVAIDRVERKGLVVRKTTTQDRRARVLELTPEGRRLAVSMFKKHARDLEAVMSVLNGKEKQQLYGPLKKLGLSAAESLEKRRVTNDSSSQK